MTTKAYFNGEIGNYDEMTIPLSDHYQRTAECRYAVKDGSVVQERYAVRQDSSLPQDGLIAYAFFESVLIGANYEQMLSSELAEKASELSAFLGDFVAVVPTEDTRVCGLVRKKKERLFDLSYYAVEIQNGKICDIKG